uniref:Uncharacterized protein n=1 Tax=Pyxicephalus adspersus TaxID=30357 RepID=A0AAV2ZKQ9_PYXAD|nr:TPA: hypothetical protein GDO54_003336 [Pyxicephalus adspersus]
MALPSSRLASLGYNESADIDRSVTVAGIVQERSKHLLSLHVHLCILTVYTPLYTAESILYTDKNSIYSRGFSSVSVPRYRLHTRSLGGTLPYSYP